MLAFSCVDRESFKQVEKHSSRRIYVEPISSKVTRWKRKVEEECGNIPMVLVMTKMDLIYRATIDACEVEKLSRSLAVKLLKTSVKENLNVSSVFEFLASQHLSELSNWSMDPPIIQVSKSLKGGSSLIRCFRVSFTDWRRWFLWMQPARFFNKVHSTCNPLHCMLCFYEVLQASL